MTLSETPQFYPLPPAFVFLGHYQGADLYVLLDERMNVLARCSNNSDDDTSGLERSYGACALLTEARRRAVKYELIEPDLWQMLHYIRQSSSSQDLFDELRQMLQSNVYSRVLERVVQGEAGALDHLRALRRTYVHHVLVHGKTQASMATNAFSSFINSIDSWRKILGMPHLPEDTRRDVIYMR